jgi:hypothetical protein
MAILEGCNKCGPSPWPSSQEGREGEGITPVRRCLYASTLMQVLMGFNDLRKADFFLSETNGLMCDPAQFVHQ